VYRPNVKTSQLQARRIVTLKAYATFYAFLATIFKALHIELQCNLIMRAAMSSYDPIPYTVTSHFNSAIPPSSRERKSVIFVVVKRPVTTRQPSAIHRLISGTKQRVYFYLSPWQRVASMATDAAAAVTVFHVVSSNCDDHS